MNQKQKRRKLKEDRRRSLTLRKRLDWADRWLQRKFDKLKENGGNHASIQATPRP